MSGTGYRLLGMVVWRGGKWYLRRNFGHLVPSRRAVALALVAGGVGVGAVVFLGRRATSP